MYHSFATGNCAEGINFYEMVNFASTNASFFNVANNRTSKLDGALMFGADHSIEILWVPNFCDKLTGER